MIVVERKFYKETGEKAEKNLVKTRQSERESVGDAWRENHECFVYADYRIYRIYNISRVYIAYIIYINNIYTLTHTYKRIYIDGCTEVCNIRVPAAVTDTQSSLTERERERNTHVGSKLALRFL